MTPTTTYQPLDRQYNLTTLTPYGFFDQEHGFQEAWKVWHLTAVMIILSRFPLHNHSHGPDENAVLG